MFDYIKMTIKLFETKNIKIKNLYFNLIVYRKKTFVQKNRESQKDNSIY